MGFWDKMKDKASDAVGEKFDSLKSIDIGSKNIGEIIKPIEDATNQAISDRNKGKKELTFTIHTKKAFSKNTQPVIIRKDLNNMYYISNRFNVESERFSFDGILWNGSTFTQETITKGNIKTSGRAGSALVGGIVAGPVGAIIGGARGKKSKVDTQSLTTSTEKGSEATIYLRSKADNTIKEIKAIFTTNDMQNASSFFSKEDTNRTSEDSNENISQLREFKKLLDEGIISQEEFDLKKKELLNL